MSVVEDRGAIWVIGGFWGGNWGVALFRQVKVWGRCSSFGVGLHVFLSHMNISLKVFFGLSLL